MKHERKNEGKLLNGKFASSRSAGNYLAGLNVRTATIYGFPIGWETFQKLAGAKHIRDSEDSPLSIVEKALIVLTGVSLGPAPTYGENDYQHRMSTAGFFGSYERYESYVENKAAAARILESGPKL